HYSARRHLYSRGYIGQWLLPNDHCRTNRKDLCAPGFDRSAQLGSDQDKCPVLHSFHRHRFDRNRIQNAILSRCVDSMSLEKAAALSTILGFFGSGNLGLAVFLLCAASSAAQQTNSAATNHKALQRAEQIRTACVE